MTWQTKNNVANVVRSARDGGSGFGSRSHPVTILNVYIYWLINLIMIIIIQILMFAQWTVSVVFFSICERRTRNRIKIFASFFLNDYVFERAIHNEPCSVQRGTIFCSAKFIQNTQQILCFTVFLLLLLFSMCVGLLWVCEGALKLQTLWLYSIFFIWRQMEIMGQWKLNQRRRAKVGKENAVKLRAIKSTQVERKKNESLNVLLTFLMMTKMMNFSASIIYGPKLHIYKWQS